MVSWCTKFSSESVQPTALHPQSTTLSAALKVGAGPRVCSSLHHHRELQGEGPICFSSLWLVTAVLLAAGWARPIWKDKNIPHWWWGWDSKLGHGTVASSFLRGRRVKSCITSPCASQWRTEHPFSYGCCVHNTIWFQIPTGFKWFELLFETWMDFRRHGLKGGGISSLFPAKRVLLVPGFAVAARFQWSLWHFTNLFPLCAWEETGLHSGTAVPSICCFVLPDLTTSGSLDGKIGMKT